MAIHKIMHAPTMVPVCMHVYVLVYYSSSHMLKTASFQECFVFMIPITRALACELSFIVPLEIIRERKKMPKSNLSGFENRGYSKKNPVCTPPLHPNGIRKIPIVQNPRVFSDKNFTPPLGVWEREGEF